MKAKFTAKNLFGVFGLAALFPLYICSNSFNFIILSMKGLQDKKDFSMIKLLMPFMIGKWNKLGDLNINF